MKYTVEESLCDFDFWGGAKDTASQLTQDQFEVIEQYMEDCAPDNGWTNTDINDFFWFDRDVIADFLGYKNWEYLEGGLSDDDIQEAEDWFESLDIDDYINIAGLNAKAYVIDDEADAGEVCRLAFDYEAEVEQEWKDKILDYIYEHYPTQATCSADSKSEQGLRERELMKNDPVLKKMREDENIAIGKAAFERLAAREQLDTGEIERDAMQFWDKLDDIEKVKLFRMHK